MRYCMYCQRLEPNHTEHCPVTKPDLKTIYKLGWTDGRQGKETQEILKENLTYLMGYGNGIVALESVENGD